jgi:hypothetical protein
MTNATQPKPNPVPAILVYGTPSGPALTQASWFRAEDQEGRQGRRGGAEVFRNRTAHRCG